MLTCDCLCGALKKVKNLIKNINENYPVHDEIRSGLVEFKFYVF